MRGQNEEKNVFCSLKKRILAAPLDLHFKDDLYSLRGTPMTF